MSTDAQVRLDRRDAFVESLVRTAHDAGAAGVVERRFALAGAGVAIRFAGPALAAPLTRALGHLDDNGPDPTLTIDVWDSETTGVAMPPPPWSHEDHLEHGRIRGFFGDDLYTVYVPRGRTLSVTDLRRRHGWHWMPSPATMPFVATANPFHAILHVWAADRGVQYVHAGAVGDEDGCVVIVGPAGRGKSSTALACLDSGIGYLGDDYCLITLDPEPTAWSLFSSAKLTSVGLARMPSFAPLVANADREPRDKAIVFVNEHWPERIVRRAPIRAIVVPRLHGGKHSSLRPATAADAFGAVAPSTVLQLPVADATTLRGLRRLAGSVPVWHLDLAEDPADVAATVRSLL